VDLSAAEQAFRPEEGSLIWFDLLAIPKDAPHVVNAHRLIIT
jgi:putrescine transport system substrate-binding protein